LLPGSLLALLRVEEGPTVTTRPHRILSQHLPQFGFGDEGVRQLPGQHVNDGGDNVRRELGMVYDTTRVYEVKVIIVIVLIGKDVAALLHPIREKGALVAIVDLSDG
jgi:hypothetical protein